MPKNLRLFAFYSSNDLACLDLEGNLLWFRGLGHDFPNASNSLGMASSPVVVGKTLIVQVESDDESFACGIDVATGVTRWKTDRPRKANWSSPTILTGRGSTGDLALLQSSAGLAAVRAETGQVVWSFNEGASTIPSSVVWGGLVFVPSNGLTALKPIPASESPEIRWQVSRLSPSTASPLAYEGKVYVVNGAGVLVCGDAKTGTLEWRLRLQGPFSGTPVAAGGHLYFFSEKGMAQAVKPGDKEGRIVGTYDLRETILCTPAIADNAIYVRSDRHLWKIVK